MVQHLQPLAHALVRSAQAALAVALYNMPNIDSEVTRLAPQIQDDLHNKSPEYGGGGAVVGEPLPLMAHLVAHAPTTTSALFVLNADSRQLGWDIPGVRAWLLGAVKALEQSIVAAFHMLAGMPSRGTEYTPMLLRNTATQMRSLLWLTTVSGQTRMFFRQLYHKTRNVTQRDT